MPPPWPWSSMLGRRAALAASAAPRGLRSFSASRHAAHRVPHITLFTGTHCSLCDDVLETLDAERTRPFTLSTYNIRDDAEPNVAYWRRKYQYEIPVRVKTHAEFARHRLDAEQLAKALSSGAERS